MRTDVTAYDIQMLNFEGYYTKHQVNAIIRKFEACVHQQQKRHEAEIAELKEQLRRLERGRPASKAPYHEFRRPDGTPVRWAHEIEEIEHANESDDSESTDDECVGRRKIDHNKDMDQQGRPELVGDDEERLDVGEYTR
ncbi:Hypothetical predicted protein [Lecanosticta acicola]|uniref:Uncharacterized protein n=1 Tax=Lecanosticta acicola TaxID=111012 RepID=A0AAI8Z4C0_9PEZI|nr:Hypothetical predicted protein [Lecanosticta acicola]